MLRQLSRLRAHRVCNLSWLSGTTEVAAGAGPGAACSSSGASASGSGAAAAAAPWAEARLWQVQQAAPYSKKAKKGSSGEAAAAAPVDGDAASFDLTETKSLMERALQHLQGELANVRTGRATPGMLDHLKVDVYGDRLPLKAVGSVSVRDAQLLVVTVFDSDAVPCVIKAVADSPLKLSPRAEGQEVLVPIPRPTQETLAAMMKVCRVEGEAAKVSVRHARKTAMDTAKKAGGSEDARKRVEKEVQKLTDDYIKEVENMIAKKEKSITLHNS